MIAWLAAERPDIHARARRYLGAADFLIHRLTGHFATDLSAACEILMVGAETGEWDAELCAIGGVDPAMQAALGWAGRSIGPITPQVAADTGLPADTLVVAGGGDQPCACLGMGMFEPGQVALATGTAWVITGVTATPRLDQIPPAMDLSFHAAPQRWTVSQFLGGFGATVDWWLQQAWQPADPTAAQGMKALYPHLNAVLAESAPGSHGLLFTPLSGPSQLPGAAPGGTLAGLQLAHTRADMARAILEGCAFEVRWALDQLRGSGLPRPNCGSPAARRPALSGRRSWPTSAACRSCWRITPTGPRWAARRWPAGAQASSRRWRRASPGSNPRFAACSRMLRSGSCTRNAMPRIGIWPAL